jgi:uroporphyrin-3 C-methyltransferase/uroporphyrinogen III methyltransferase/synthase
MNETLIPVPPESKQNSTANAGEASEVNVSKINTPAILDTTVENSARRNILKPFNLVYLALAALAVLLIAQWWSSTNQIAQLREELAHRLQAVDISTAETKIIARSMQETNKELQVKIGVLENKEVESESHALALQQLYQDLSKNRDDWALSEIEQVLSTASQQLQLAGNVQGALIALQNADARLARSDKPQFITIRRSIARDIDRLKALPNLDLPGIALRLDSAIAQIETMPLWVDENQVVIANPVKAPPKTAVAKNAATSGKDAHYIIEEPSASWTQWVDDRWQSWSTEMWDQIRQLVRIRNVDNPDALLLSPSQGYFAKENVKLRLLNARLALLSRSEAPFRSDMIAAQDEIARYFDTRSKQTQTVQALLRQIQNSNVSIEMPSLAESLNAVRNFTVKQ